MKPTLIKHYKSQGWQFISENCISHHNGDESDLHFAKSPRMKEKELISEPWRGYKSCRASIPWDGMTEAELLDWEAEAMTRQIFKELDQWSQPQAYADLKAALLTNASDPSKLVTITIIPDTKTYREK